jgi:hypothetical protein
VAGGAGAALVAILMLSGRMEGGHPQPRDGVTAERVLPTGLIPRTPGALESYAAARAAPHVLDGLYCYCDCSRHAGHRSLLTCFESDHGAYCDVCMGEALLAQQLAARGQALATIRAAIDARFGG